LRMLQVRGGRALSSDDNERHTWLRCCRSSR
jgi:hypothetical protein